MLTDFVGIGDLKELLIKYANDGFKEDLAFYPMGVPINEGVAHDFACTGMIGKNWREHKNIEVEPEWGLAGTFNVLQCFFYQSSKAFVGKNEEADSLIYLGYMKKILEEVLPKLFEFNKALFGLVFGEANS
jgi:hypothetical protein